jgi:hypothetical protein
MLVLLVRTLQIRNAEAGGQNLCLRSALFTR